MWTRTVCAKVIYDLKAVRKFQTLCKLFFRHSKSRGAGSPGQGVNWPRGSTDPPKIWDWGQKIDTSLMSNWWFWPWPPVEKWSMRACLSHAKVYSVWNTAILTKECKEDRLLAFSRNCYRKDMRIWWFQKVTNEEPVLGQIHWPEYLNTLWNT